MTTTPPDVFLRPAGAAAARFALTALQPRRVAVFRALQLGDMLCAVPALRALRQLWPQAHITLVGLPWAADFARRFSHLVDGFLPFPGHPQLPERTPDPDGWAPFVHAAAAADFDLTVQLHGDGSRSNAIVEAIPAPHRAGFSNDVDEGPWFTGLPNRGPELRRLLALPLHLGAESPDEAMEFPLLPSDLAEWQPWPEVRELIDERGRARRPFACVHVGARAPERRWPVAHFAQVADALSQATGWPIVLTGSDAEQPLTQAMGKVMQRESIDAAAPVSAGALAAVIGAARMVVSNDTGVSHLAAALKVPSVVVFRASDMDRWAPLDRQRHRCVWDPQGERVDTVLGEVEDLLGSLGASGSSDGRQRGG